MAGQLTARQAQILADIAAGRSDKEIAQRLNLSYHTVRTHVKHILHQLGVSSRTEAAAWYWREKLGG